MGLDAVEVFDEARSLIDFSIDSDDELMLELLRLEVSDIDEEVKCLFKKYKRNLKFENAEVTGILTN